MAKKDQGREVLSAGAGLAAEVALESGAHLGEVQAVRARGYWEQVWLRFKKDKVAIASGCVIILLILAATIGGPLAERWLGHGPNDIYPSPGVGVDLNLVPVGPNTHAKNFNPETGVEEDVYFPLGTADTLGRDELLRLLYGARVSLMVAIGATLLSMFIGVLLGATAGFFRGWIDSLISRLTEIVMAFPLLLFVIALAATVGDRMQDITFGGAIPPGVVMLVLVGGVFGWFYPARIIRAQVLSLREKEFIEAAQMVGSSDWRIIRSHLLPHLVAPMIVYSTLIVAQFVLFEAGLSFLGVGIKLPTASWGSLLSTAPEFYLQQPWLMVWPGAAVLITTLSFNLLGDGLRDAFDPRASAH
ncbi:MAG TPA: ABC transporter permease [Gaiellaceae bacterium]|jgi:peptide/nickel transport system permease protein